MRNNFSIKHGLKCLQRIFNSRAYKDELAEISSYAANTKQETILKYFLVKHLRERGLDTVMECRVPEGAGKYDLTIKNTAVEVKFYYDWDLLKLQRELKEYDFNRERMLTKLKEGNNATRSQICLEILRDFEKKPDVFILVILSRDLKGVTDNWGRSHVGWYEKQCKYNATHSYDDRALLDRAKDYVEKIAGRKFEINRSYLNISAEVKREFPATYHFHVFDFA